MNKEEFEKNFTEFFEKQTNVLVDAYKQLEVKVQAINTELQEKNRLLEESVNQNKTISNTLNNILESISNGIIVIDKKGFITMVNSATSAITGLSKYDIEGKKYNDIFNYLENSDRLTCVLDNLQDSIESEKILIKGNIKIPVLYHLSLMRNYEGEIIGAIESLTDLSIIKQMEDKFIQHKTLAGLGEMAATVAHEIRNPLGAIGGFVGMLKEIVDEDEKQQHMIIDKTIRSITVLNKTVTNLLAFTKGMEINIKSMKANEFFLPILEIIEDNIRRSGKQINFITEISPFESLILKMDHEKLTQVMVNLLVNSVQAISERGTIKTGMKMKGLDKLLFFVEDSEGSLPKKNIEKIFNPFYTTKENGTGLGLAICNKIVELHRGKFNVVVEENKSTKFMVEIPQ